MKIDILVDGQTVHTQQADRYYYNEYMDMVNTLSAKLGVRLGERNLTMEQICMGVDMLIYGRSVEWIRKEAWGRN